MTDIIQSIYDRLKQTTDDKSYKISSCGNILKTKYHKKQNISLENISIDLIMLSRKKPYIKLRSLKIFEEHFLKCRKNENIDIEHYEPELQQTTKLKMKSENTNLITAQIYHSGSYVIFKSKASSMSTLKNFIDYIEKMLNFCH